MREKQHSAPEVGLKTYYLEYGFQAYVSPGSYQEFLFLLIL